MSQHYPKGTLGAPKWCNKCKTFTTHRVNDGGPVTRVCIPCQEKAEAAHQARLANPEKPAAVQEALFAAVLFVFFLISPRAHAQTLEPSGATFSTSSKIEMSLAGAAIAGDAYTTRRFNDLGYRDRNFLARLFVSSNAGTVAYFGASFSGVVLSNRMLRNHPRLRHVLNWTVIGGETFATAYNAGFLSQVERRKKRL